jgi:hypothetical protein
MQDILFVDGTPKTAFSEVKKAYSQVPSFPPHFLMVSSL